MRVNDSSLFSLAVRATIKSNLEISHIFSSGTRYNGPGLTLIVIPAQQHDHIGRVAFIAGKKNGNAVWRNSAKRRMRALCQDLQGPWKSHDVVFLAKRNILDIPYAQLKSTTAKLVSRFSNTSERSSE